MLKPYMFMNYTQLIQTTPKPLYTTLKPHTSMLMNYTQLIRTKPKPHFTTLKPDPLKLSSLCLTDYKEIS